MKSSMLGLSFRNLLALSALALGASLSAACTVEPVVEESDPAEASAPPAPEPQAPECCKKVGNFTCPDTGNEYYYYPLGFCGPLKTAASNACNAACDDPCIDSGWYNDCLP